jgi:hypothetical protein
MELDHSPLASLDYGFNWDLWLTSPETIVDNTWTVSPNTIELNNLQITGNTTSVYAIGGVINTIYKLTNTITTSADRVDSRSLILTCKNR